MQRTGEYEEVKAADSVSTGPELIPVDYDPFNDPTSNLSIGASRLPPTLPVTTPPDYGRLAQIVSCLREFGVPVHVTEVFLAEHGTTLAETRARAPRLRIEYEGQLCFVPAGSTEAEVAAELELQDYLWRSSEWRANGS